MISLDTLWSRSAEMYSEIISLLVKSVSPFMDNVRKWPSILEKSGSVNTERFLKVCLPILQHYALCMKGSTVSAKRLHHIV